MVMSELPATNRREDATKRPQSSIGTSMWVVGIVALNLAVGRAIYRFLPWRLAGVFLIGLLIQVGLVCLFRSRGRRRLHAFWAGFELGGLLGLTSFLYARVPDSWMGSLWEQYAEFIDLQFRIHLGLSVLTRGADDPILLATVAAFGFLPQFLVALGGGLLGLSLRWSARSWVLVLKVFAIVAILVLQVAAWLTAWYALPARPPWLISGVTPSGLMLQVGSFGLIRNFGRPRDRAFWTGFLTVGSLVFCSYLWAMIIAHSTTGWNLRYWPNGPWYVRPVPNAPMWALWIDYTALVSYLLGRPPHGTYFVEWRDQPIDSLVYALIILLPHLLAALGGGFLALRIARLAGLQAQRGRVAVPELAQVTTAHSLDGRRTPPII
jgi:hypothetical protein